MEPLSDAQRFDWLRLIRAENVGPATFNILLKRYGSATAALAALPELSRRGGMGRPIRIPDTDTIDREFAAVRRNGGAIIARGEDGYPPRLVHIDQPPPMLCVSGRRSTAARPMIAIVGARNASAGGRQIARTFARELGEAGYIIVSGLALGVDACAHEASLATGTVAVLAGGIARIYPERHQPLSDDIRANGLLVTEMPPHHAPRNRDFPRRNRIISGCALGTVVIEAAQRSGSLITARFALEQNREVFAVPGSPLDPRAQGTNRLIRDGATLVARTSHILDMLAPLLAEDGENHAGPEARDAGSAGSAPGESFSPETGSPETGSRGTESPETGSPEDESARTAQRSVETPEPDLKARVVALLSPTPVGIDALIRETGTSASKVQGALLELELAGVAARHTGNRFTRVPD